MCPKSSHLSPGSWATLAGPPGGRAAMAGAQGGSWWVLGGWRVLAAASLGILVGSGGRGVPVCPGGLLCGMQIY